MVQLGSFAGLAVTAFGLNSDTGYTFADLPWTPRIGTHLDAASGGANRTTGKMYTYQPHYPITYYYLPNNFFSPTNFYDVSPRFSLVPARELRIDAYYAFLWRYSVAPGIGRARAAPTLRTDGARAEAVHRNAADIALHWTPEKHLRFRFEYAVFFPGSALRAVQGKITSYINATVQFRF